MPEKFFHLSLMTHRYSCSMHLSRLCLITLMAFSFHSCLQKPVHSAGFPYDLSMPEKIFELPHSLREISGITFYNDRKMACIQDEKGKIYIYNLKKQDVKESVDFGSDHDYEGIALVNDTFFVLHSTGTLFEIIHFDSDSQQTIRINTFLKKENNTEGLCYDSFTNSLLIACKGVSHKKEKTDIKEIYRYNLPEQTLDSKPAYKIHVSDIEKYFHEHGMAVPASEKENSFFEPSEIAVHPVTHDIYLLSSVGKILIILDRNGAILEAATFSADIAAHPEGMTFSADGNLFISSEGKGDKKVILEYKPLR
jgi:uncharacterized protein YjiK